MVEQLAENELRAIREIRNAIVHRGKSPSIRELMKALHYKSPRSAAVIVERLIKKGFLRRQENENLRLVKDLENDSMRARTIDVPLIGTITCGAPILTEENVEATIPVSTKLARPPFKYFLLRAKGDSMNLRGIKNGDLVLVRKELAAQNGDRVVALIDDEAAVKEFHATPEAIVLKPRSTNKKHKPIVLTKDFRIQGVVVATIPNL